MGGRQGREEGKGEGKEVEISVIQLRVHPERPPCSKCLPASTMTAAAEMIAGPHEASIEELNHPRHNVHAGHLPVDCSLYSSHLKLCILKLLVRLDQVGNVP